MFDQHDDYYIQAQKTQEAAHQRRVAASKQKMRLKTKEIRWYAESHLQHVQWSPETIAGKLTAMGRRMSAEAIYRWINHERPDFKGSLLIAGKSRRRRRTVVATRPKPHAAAPERSIDVYTTEVKSYKASDISKWMPCMESREEEVSQTILEALKPQLGERDLRFPAILHILLAVSGAAD